MVLENQTTNSVSSLPDEVWEIMASPKTIEFNIKLGEKYKLNPDKIHIIALIEAGVFHKKFSLQEFPKILKEKLALDLKTTRELTNDINKNLFIPLRNYLGVLPPITAMGNMEKKTEEKFKELKPEIAPPLKKKEKFLQGTLPTYKEKISPYEKKRGISPGLIVHKKAAAPIISKTITPSKIEKPVSKKPFQAATPKIIPVPKIKQAATEKAPRIENLDDYQIRTMKKDIEKAKKKFIPPKPKVKVKNKVVDLSGK